MQTISIEYNSILIIESLRHNDIKTGKNLYDEIRRLHPDHKGIQYLPVVSADDFTELMTEIELQMTQNNKFRPIIDIETHGDSSCTQFADGSIMKWGDLMNITRRLNKITNNELVVFLACCEGYRFLNSMSVAQYSPCGYLYAPPYEIHDVVINSATVVFFNEITESGDLDKAADLLRRMNINCFKSEIFFLNALTHSLINDFQGDGKLKTDIDREEIINKLSIQFLGQSNKNYTSHVIKCFNEYINPD
ncbi:TPA: hypothetical protein ACJILP_000561 [Enterobacter ludwigii]